MQILNKRIEIALNAKNFLIDTVESLDDLLAEVQEEDEIPFWAELWPAARALARFMASNQTLVQLKVLELGAGLGLPGIVAAAQGAHVVQTDYSPAAVAACAHNAGINGVTTSPVMADWRSFPDLGVFDWCIASDVLYEPTFHANLLEIFDQVLAPQGRIVISDPGREYAKKFMAQLAERGFCIEKIEEVEICEGRGYKIDLYIATPMGR